MPHLPRRACLTGALLIALALPAAAADAQRIARILAQTPLIDGHNDLPWEIRSRFASDLARADLSRSTVGLPAPEGSPPLMSDIPRLKAGHVGAQFWSVWIPAETQGRPPCR
jgi:membrane dipeptidase